MKKPILTFIIFCFTLVSGIAEDKGSSNHNLSIKIPEVALLDIEDENGNDGSITLAPDISGLEAGEAINFNAAVNNSLWLNYTSVVNKQNGNSGKKRKIAVKIESGSLPGGTKLVLQVDDANSGSGKLGKAVSGKIELDDSEKDIITNIGSGYTGTGSQKGYRLTYSMEMDNSEYNELIAKSYFTQILYTITDK